MPVYEFYCTDCHRIYNFFSSRVNTDKRPPCPRCGRSELERQVSMFSAPKGLNEDAEEGIPDIDESRLERAMATLEKEAGSIDENDPRQAANLMRKLTDMTGLDLGPGMEEALSRMEAGEDPEQIEAEMGDLLEGDEPFMAGKKKPAGRKKPPPARDDELYYL